MLQNSSEFNNVGPGFPGYGGFGGFGGIGLVGLIGLLGRRGLGGDGDDNCAREAAILAAISNSKDATVAEGRGLAAAICDSEKTNLQQFYAAAIQSANNTQAIKDQATAFAIVNDKRFDDLAAAGVAQTAAIIAKLNQTELDGLRDQLTLERTRVGRFEAKEEITQLGIAFGNQIQAANSNVVAVQTQIGQLTNVIHALASQLNKTSNDVINFGTMAASGNQATQTTNVKS